MNVFHRYTRQALRKNRSRTWVTIVGIILSVALFTAVTEVLTAACSISWGPPSTP